MTDRLKQLHELKQKLQEAYEKKLVFSVSFDHLDMMPDTDDHQNYHTASRLYHRIILHENTPGNVAHELSNHISSTYNVKSFVIHDSVPLIQNRYAEPIRVLTFRTYILFIYIDLCGVTL
jgi:hypothetical protein